MAERSKALQLSCRGLAGCGFESRWRHLNFSLPPRSEQVNGAVANEIKHVLSPEVIVVLDPRYDLSYKALYISTCSIALKIRDPRLIRQVLHLPCREPGLIHPVSILSCRETRLIHPVSICPVENRESRLIHPVSIMYCRDPRLIHRLNHAL